MTWGRGDEATTCHVIDSCSKFVAETNATNRFVIRYLAATSSAQKYPSTNLRRSFLLLQRLLSSKTKTGVGNTIFQLFSVGFFIYKTSMCKPISWAFERRARILMNPKFAKVMAAHTFYQKLRMNCEIVENMSSQFFTLFSREAYWFQQELNRPKRLETLLIGQNVPMRSPL